MGALYHSIPYTDHGPDKLTVTMGMLVFMLLSLNPSYREIVTYKELMKQDAEYGLASNIHAWSTLDAYSEETSAAVNAAGQKEEEDDIQGELSQSLSRAQVVDIPVQGFSQESDAPLPSPLPNRTYRKHIPRRSSLERDALTRVQGSRIVTRSRTQLASAAAAKKKKKK
ncbi:hypothetical protein PG993_005141 [Apiospora rasikravindrae]|uniref:Uncharacterized protein n=1 Tax=Apiospora rasikravindrae TaxID=990691 RepID=A0ABR1TEU1_9PEZI